MALRATYFPTNLLMDVLSGAPEEKLRVSKMLCAVHAASKLLQTSNNIECLLKPNMNSLLSEIDRVCV